MRILVNALSATVGGGVTALKRLLPEMLAIDGGRHRYLLLVSAQQRATLDLDHERLTRIEVSTPRRSLLRALDEQLVVPFHADGRSRREACAGIVRRGPAHPRWPR